MSTGGCQWKINGKTHYQRNKQYYLDKNKRYKNRNIEFIKQYKLSHPCADCDISDIRVLEFDHMPGDKKIFNIGEARALSMSLKSLKKEINKCEVVCANCHRIRTITRAHSLMDKATPF